MAQTATGEADRCAGEREAALAADARWLTERGLLVRELEEWDA